MNRLQRELQRLYGLPAIGPDLDAPRLMDADGRVRAMVLALARPADWATLSAVWSGVQADLALPAPAIAVNGVDGFELWFSVAVPVSALQAQAFLDGLRRRYLGDIAPARVALRPAPEGDPAPQPPPVLQAGTGLWSAFVAPDLAPMFADEPWLDVPPNPDGQAQLLASLKSMASDQLELALQRLQPTPLAAATAPASEARTPASASLDPRRFLLDVMNNERLDWALRIEAAKALLPPSGGVVGG